MIPFVRAVDIQPNTLPNLAGVFKPGFDGGRRHSTAGRSKRAKRERKALSMMFANRHRAPLPAGTRPLDEAQIRDAVGVG
jgi:hypothetical protein